MSGGKRPGAGRKKGTPNKSNAERMAAIAASGETPMDYMLRVMRDPKTAHDRRDRLAAAVAPYVHAKLASIEHAGPDGGPIPIQQIVRRIVRHDSDARNTDSASVPAIVGTGSI